MWDRRTGQKRHLELSDLTEVNFLLDPEVNQLCLFFGDNVILPASATMSQKYYKDFLPYIAHSDESIYCLEAGSLEVSIVVYKEKWPLFFNSISSFGLKHYLPSSESTLF